MRTIYLELWEEINRKLRLNIRKTFQQWELVGYEGISHVKQLILLVLKSLKTEQGKVFCKEYPEELLQDDLFFFMYTRHYGLERKPQFLYFPCQRCSLSLLLHEVKNIQLNYLVALSLYEVFINWHLPVSDIHNKFIFQSGISLSPTSYVLPRNTGLVTSILNVLS